MMAEAIGRMGIGAWIHTRHLATMFAEAFGVSRTTAWRDLKYILWGGRVTNVVSGEDILAIVTTMYRGGPVVSVTDAASCHPSKPGRKRPEMELPKIPPHEKQQA